MSDRNRKAQQIDRDVTALVKSVKRFQASGRIESQSGKLSIVGLLLAKVVAIDPEFENTVIGMTDSAVTNPARKVAKKNFADLEREGLI